MVYNKHHNISVIYAYFKIIIYFCKSVLSKA